MNERSGHDADEKGAAMTTANDPNVARADRLDTATLSDALDKLGIVGQCYRIKPRHHDFRMAGRAWRPATS